MVTVSEHLSTGSGRWVSRLALLAPQPADGSHLNQRKARASSVGGGQPQSSQLPQGALGDGLARITTMTVELGEQPDGRVT